VQAKNHQHGDHQGSDWINRLKINYR